MRRYEVETVVSCVENRRDVTLGLAVLLPSKDPHDFFGIAGPYVFAVSVYGAKNSPAYRVVSEQMRVGYNLHDLNGLAPIRSSFFWLFDYQPVQFLQAIMREVLR